MVQAKELQVRFEQATDPETGWRFTLLSLQDDHLVLPYFHREMWSSDGRWILCERHNVRLTYLCDWQDGRAEVLHDHFGEVDQVIREDGVVGHLASPDGGLQLRGVGGRRHDDGAVPLDLPHQGNQGLASHVAERRVQDHQPDGLVVGVPDHGPGGVEDGRGDPRFRQVTLQLNPRGSGRSGSPAL